jgi:hypothetical protein
VPVDLLAKASLACFLSSIASSLSCSVTSRSRIKSSSGSGETVEVWMGGSKVEEEEESRRR